MASMTAIDSGSPIEICSSKYVPWLCIVGELKRLGIADVQRRSDQGNSISTYQR